MFNNNSGMRELESVADEQLLLPFDFEEPKIDVASIPHYEDPQDDNEQLLEYQYQYKVEGKENALSKMYELGYSVCRRYIDTEGRQNRHVKLLSREDKAEKAHNAITYIIARYKRVLTFFIAKSFTAYLFLRVRHELYYTRKVDKLITYVDYL